MLGGQSRSGWLVDCLVVLTGLVLLGLGWFGLIGLDGLVWLVRCVGCVGWL